MIGWLKLGRRKCRDPLFSLEIHTSWIIVIAKKKREKERKKKKKMNQRPSLTRTVWYIRSGIG